MHHQKVYGNTELTQKPRMCWGSALPLPPFICRNCYYWEPPLPPPPPPKSELLSSISQEGHTLPRTPTYVWVKCTHIGRYVCVDACVHTGTYMCIYRHTAQSSSPVLSTEHALLASSKSSQPPSVQNTPLDCRFAHMTSVSSLGVLREAPVSS